DLHQLAQQRGERGARHEVGAVMAEVDAGQRDLRAPGLDEQADLVGHELGLQTAAGPPRARHDAEGAAVLAAVLDLEKRARAADRLPVGDLGARRHRAGVDDDDVRGGTERHRRKAARLEGRLQPLAVDLVEAAPEGREGDAAARHATASFNWPQAAPMSSPLLQRTVVVMPASSRIDWKARMRASGGRRNPEAGQSLNGIRFTLAR